MEASIAGLDFLDELVGYDRTIIVDAVQTRGGKPGEIRRFEPGTFTTTCHANSPHDVNFATALELGKRLGLDLPRLIVIFGIEVEDVTSFGEECTPAVMAAIPDCVNRILHELNNNSSVVC